MKISCPSCQSKYTIADEKVQGRSVKVRCRKCGETIQVSEGGIVGSAASEAGAADNVDGGAAYSVLIAEGDQRDMSIEEIVAGYNSGVITGDTFVWADGQSDWMALSQVPSIVQALNAASEAVDRQRAIAAEPPPASAPKPAVATPLPVKEPAPATTTPLGASAAPSATKTPVGASPAASLFGASPAPTATKTPVGASPAASLFGDPIASPPVDQAAVDRRSPKIDLFGSAKIAGSEDEVATSAPQIGSVVAPKATGTREEASVLFSLSALTASAASSSSSSGASPSASSSSGSSDDSGLIDLRALANKADQPKAAAAVAAPVAILDAAPLLGTPLLDVSASAPVDEPAAEKKGSKMLLFIGAGIAFAGVAIALAIILTRKPPPAPLPAPTATDTAAAATTTPPPAQPVDSSAAAPATGAPTASAAPKGATAGGKGTAGKGGKKPDKSDDKGSAAAAPAATTAKKPAASPCGCAPADLACAMRCSATGGKK
jgi:predicted Zn finger-like uncharacterized protein